ncbi:MAG: bifunctional 4-hydroxy-2-oxoglutarate aldolase/2-dehydro-3-deoxy-phosphogluconate aldolase [Methylibium sp.]|uniref:bifunctional 4-hydroxy-2-oxoglutarate aldolase/2-dehydro-3-deoxy-phosphogluconate aldolase n=1 Tax=Methylibium sp. TaxID=2067992 RepID=UPI0017AB60EF|nr:bifunctional 4-hydroxy-2-oxoglutarate aldolase/2-dehydro-3-deoxy-phosphogluconate aldolase [Methylibium sp.]MBA3592144.1 bifunctional 4-hydroxy-2-oxoglutarate aldolase/2-dehydro-3-deoxy-phosphogluconate aldolase [Methylibium sp.]MBA3625968.1 bifunctional 4-hydroxy-2-oxoglutarate aldolase/2-dehydro-3-deoxy-phosphogluconate aldolase [Methylibium sp.]
MTLDDILDAGPVIPVIVIERPEDAEPLARALVRGGLRVLEVTLRTPAALDAIRAMCTVEGAIVGAGTVLGSQQYDAAVEAGAQFVVSPGLTDSLAAFAKAQKVPLLPGTATASEVMRAREAGFTRLKFFPAESSGGVATLKGFASVFPDVRFCPTGGISSDSATAYLRLANVACVGGSWPMPPEAIATRDWGRIERLAGATAALRRAAV